MAIIMTPILAGCMYVVSRVKKTINIFYE
ncbi:Protein of unknown function [Bacillus mycoides]|uniref:Uncharacterized protein n=1 Tax=Bacillus mycoides TaxID=1405 RepID=A0A1G4EK93_BACMY|nr:Protein of unknown function [Bacillus mycoides]